jgi:hypothetical protein
MQQRITLVAGISAGMLALAACGGSSGGAATPAPTAAAGGVDLAGVCPATVSVQTDWYPEAEHGHLYQLLGSDYTIDSKHKSITGPLMSGGKPTGINLEIKAGGPAIGYQNVSTQLYQNKDITLGYVGTDDAIQYSKTLPTTAVFAELNLSPFMIMWDPKKYPTVTDLPQLGAALKANGGVVRYFSGSAYMKYLISKGIFDKSITDGSYDGTPAKFVAGQGKDAQQGFASAEPYIYAHEVPAWDKEVKYALVSTTGWTSYSSSIAVRNDKLSSLSGCLTKLVPVMQQGLVDYMANPGPTNDLILKVDHAYSKSWPYTIDVANFAVTSMKQNKIVSDGGAAFVGSFDPARVDEMLKIAAPIFAKSGTANPEVKATDLYTNQFLSKTIKLGY